MKTVLGYRKPCRAEACSDIFRAELWSRRRSYAEKLCPITELSPSTMDSNYEDMFAAIDACYYRALVVPCLSLVYTVIDTISWLAYGGKEASSKKRFLKWTETYLLPQLGSSYDSIDIYAARCSILHGLSWESDLSKNHKARSIVYSIGRNTENSSELDKEIFSKDHVASIHIDTFIASLKAAVNTFFLDVASCDELKIRIRQANGKRYAKIKIDDYAKLVATVKASKSQPVIPLDLREKPRRPVNSDGKSQRSRTGHK